MWILIVPLDPRCRATLWAQGYSGSLLDLLRDTAVSVALNSLIRWKTDETKMYRSNLSIKFSLRFAQWNILYSFRRKLVHARPDKNYSVLRRYAIVAQLQTISSTA